jgi:hypothetical protein
MKLHASVTAGLMTITAYDAGYHRGEWSQADAQLSADPPSG